MSHALKPDPDHNALIAYIVGIMLVIIIAGALASCGTPYQPPGEDLWLTVN